MNSKYNNIFGICKHLCVIALLSFTVFCGCTDKGQRNNISEGSMKFKITYLQTEKENPIIGLLPSTIMMHFKNDKVILEMEGWLGIFRSAFIKDGRRNAYTLLKILNRKYLYVSKSEEGYYGMSRPDNLQIDFDDVDKEIIGFHCNHANVTIDTISFDVFYTTDIKINNATANTPLDMIPGMPMDFRLEMNGIPMHLEAIEFINEKITDKTFEIPEGYERVQRSQMDEIFNGIGK